MIAVVSHDVIGCDEGRHVATGLTWQVGIDGPVVLVLLCDGILLSTSLGSAMATDGLVDVLRTAVIGRNHEVPVAEDTVEVAQQTGSGKGGLHWVATLVDK